MRNRLLQLLSENRKPFEPIQNKIVAKDGAASIYLYDAIVGDRLTAEWWGGVCPQDFVPAVRAIEADQITIYTNCPGGDVFAAEAMCQALREHPAKVKMQIEGYAASAATAIACACDEVVATPASKYMIHNTWTLALGNADDLEAVVELLRKCDGTMYDAYEQRSGKSRDQIIEWCKAETWFTAAQAVEQGFIDQVLDSASARRVDPAASRKWNLSAYANAPVIEPPAAPAQYEKSADPFVEALKTAFKSEDTHQRDRQQQRLRLARLAHQ
ncbi:MAG: Clp protease ClpP [Xylophilus ampelinus]